jgi:hypothetical protein
MLHTNNPGVWDSPELIALACSTTLNVTVNTIAFANGTSCVDLPLCCYPVYHICTTLLS